MGETYYDVLGIDRDATQAEIKAAYRERVLETHPDHNDDPDAAGQFARVSTAESVLGDETERARYDRLGHESYVRLADATAASPRGGGDSEADQQDGSATASSAKTTTSQTATGTRRTTNEHRSWHSGTDGPAEDPSGRDRTHRASGRSHHARYRYRRERRTARRRATGDWPFDDESDRTGNRAGTAAGSRTRSSNAHATDDRSTDDESGFRYAVHEWDDDVELRWEGRRPDHQTLVGLGALTLLYPLFIYASLSPTLSLLTNAIVAACTLLIVGFMLTMPRVAMVAFGGWSVLLPIGLYVGPVDSLSMYGLLAIACCWIPFGYAIAVWRALRP